MSSNVSDVRSRSEVRFSEDVSVTSVIYRSVCPNEKYRVFLSTFILTEPCL